MYNEQIVATDNIAEGDAGDQLRDAATVAQWFLRRNKTWLEQRFGECDVDPWGPGYDIDIFIIDSVSIANSGPSVGAALTGE